MDSLERAAGIGDPASQADSGVTVSSDPAKTVEPAQQAQQQVEPASDANYLHTPQSDPELEAQRQRMVGVERDMISNNTRRTKEREETFRRDQESLTAERQQLAAMMQQQSAQMPEQPQQSGNGGILEHMSPHLKAVVQAQPDLQEMFLAIERSSQGAVKSVHEQNEALSGKVEELQGQLNRQQEQAVLSKYQPQAAALHAKYGDALTPDVSQAVVQEAVSKNLTLEAAMLSVAPNVVLNSIQIAADAAANQRIHDRYPDLGALIGMNDEIVGTPPAETFQPQESFEKSFIRNHGRMAYLDAIRDED